MRVISIESKKAANRYYIKTCNEAIDIKLNARNGWSYDELVSILNAYRLRRVAEFTAKNFTDIYVERIGG